MIYNDVGLQRCSIYVYSAYPYQSISCNVCVCETDATKDFAYIAIHNGMYSICKWVYDGIMRDPPISVFSGSESFGTQQHPSTSMRRPSFIR